VRIGIDMFAVQSPGGRMRGIARYSHGFVSALLAAGANDQFYLYGHAGYPTDRIPRAANAASHLLERDLLRGEATFRAVIDRLARTNPDGLDLLLVPSPIEFRDDYAPPAHPLDGLSMAAVVYDLNPILFQETYLTDPCWDDKHHAHLRTLGQYDCLLAVSEATRADCLRLLELPEERVAWIGVASDPRFFTADRAVPMPLAARATLHRLGITRPYVFNVGSMEDRRNLFGLIDAFRLLPVPLRLNYQLVLSCSMTDAFAKRVRAYASERGVIEPLVLTNEVSDETLRILYRHCSVFAFPSFYERFGLPLLEAMQCGAPVIAGDNSAQIEIIGAAGLFANLLDAADLASKLGRVLIDPDLWKELSSRATERAKQFTWMQTANRALAALYRTEACMTPEQPVPSVGG
jgi:glycosyltransferase involved in cell wall biosynthesis